MTPAHAERGVPEPEEMCARERPGKSPVCQWQKAARECRTSTRTFAHAKPRLRPLRTRSNPATPPTLRGAAAAETQPTDGAPKALAATTLGANDWGPRPCAGGCGRPMAPADTLCANLVTSGSSALAGGGSGRCSQSQPHMAGPTYSSRPPALSKCTGTSPLSGPPQLPW